MPWVLNRTASTGPSCPLRHAASLLGRCSLGGSSVSGGGAGPSGRGGMAGRYRWGMACAARMVRRQQALQAAGSGGSRRRRRRRQAAAPSSVGGPARSMGRSSPALTSSFKPPGAGPAAAQRQAGAEGWRERSRGGGSASQ